MAHGKHIRVASFDEPEWITFTTAWLLDQFISPLNTPDQFSDYYWAAPGDHCSWSPWFSVYAPQPRKPETSECRLMSGEFSGGFSTIPIPFYPSRNKCHHIRSDKAYPRWFFLHPFNKSNILHRSQSIYLEGIPLKTEDCWDSFFADSSTINFSFWCGRWRIIRLLLISIPKKVMHIAGPSIFSGATGTLRCSNNASNVYRCLLLSPELRGDIVKKSSRIFGIPSNFSLHSSTSTIAEKILGAYLNPNERAQLINRLPFHIIPSSKWSSGCTGTMQ